MSKTDQLRNDFSRLAGEVNGLGQRIEKLKEIQQDLMSLPLPKDDFSASLEVWVDQQAQKFPGQLAKAVEHLVGQPYVDPADVEIELRGSQEAEESGGVGIFPLLAYVFGDQLKEALRTATGQMAWPSRVGPPRSRRDTLLEKTAAKLEMLENKESALMAAAKNLISLLGAGNMSSERDEEGVSEREPTSRRGPSLAPAPRNDFSARPTLLPASVDLLADKIAEEDAAAMEKLEALMGGGSDNLLSLNQARKARTA